MKKFNYCPIIQIGDVFKRIDRNGKVWTAEVINRTEYFVDVKKTQPYQIKVANDDISGQLGCWHYEDAPDTFERCMLHQVFVDKEDGIETYTNLFGKKVTKPKIVKVPTNKYTIEVKENFSKSFKWDKPYELIKSNGTGKNAEEWFELFWKFCEEFK